MNRNDAIEEVLREVQKDIARAAINDVIWTDTQRMIRDALAMPVEQSAEPPDYWLQYLQMLMLSEWVHEEEEYSLSRQCTLAAAGLLDVARHMEPQS